nr:metal-dependent hydrolase [Salinilacihabitans rarus]
MATTHVFVGLAAVAPVAYVAPELAAPLAVGAVCGGIAPDLDVAFEHRRTLHFPVYGVVPAALAAAVAALTPSTLAVGLAAFAVVAWLHAASDALGGGPEFDPWAAPREEAVYDHARGRWVRPRRWIRYDGAPEDVGAVVVFAIPAVVVFDGWVHLVVAAGVAVSLAYALVRRRLPEWAPDWVE